MSTRAYINVKRKDGLVYSSYLHFDGHLAFETLQQHYNSQDLAEALSNFGDMSSLGKYINSKGNTHSFANPEPDICVFYGRDRGETYTCATPYISFEACRNDKNALMGIEFIYEWDGVSWTQIPL